MNAKQPADLATRLTPGNLGYAISHMVGIKKPLFIWGPPGVGKSDIVREVATMKGMDVIDVRLSQMEHSDIRGIPFLTVDNTTSENDRISRAIEMVKTVHARSVNELSFLGTESATPLMNLVKTLSSDNDKIMKWAPPDFLPRDPNTKAILFLDEFSSVSNGQTLAACYQLLLDRRVGAYTLPDGVVIVAAGNRISDRGVSFRLPSPIANRMTHIELVASPDEWIEWAINHTVHPEVVGYISFSKGALATGFDTASPDLRGFPTPRSWVSVSTILSELDPTNMLPTDVLQALVAGTVGDGEAIKFMDYRRRSAELPQPMDVLTGKIREFHKPDQKKDPGLGFSLTVAVVYELEILNNKEKSGDITKDQFMAMVDNFFGFALKSFQPEIVIAAVRQISKRAVQFKLDVRQLPNFTEVRKKYANILHKQASVS